MVAAGVGEGGRVPPRPPLAVEATPAAAWGGEGAMVADDWADLPPRLARGVATGFGDTRRRPVRAAELQLPWRGSPAGMAKAAIGCQRHVVGVVV